MIKWLIDLDILVYSHTERPFCDFVKLRKKPSHLSLLIFKGTENAWTPYSQSLANISIVLMEMDVNKVVPVGNKHINSHWWLLAFTLAPLGSGGPFEFLAASLKLLVCWIIGSSCTFTQNSRLESSYGVVEAIWLLLCLSFLIYRCRWCSVSLKEGKMS